YSINISLFAVVATPGNPCDSEDEYRCRNNECISSTLKCDNNSDENDDSCSGNLSKHNKRWQHLHGILIACGIIILFVGTILFIAYWICRRCIHRQPTVKHVNNYETIHNSVHNDAIHDGSNNKNELKATRVVLKTKNCNNKTLDENYGTL
ncbi:unnamed protein product, partial [Didymodactylos carnosus]